MSTQLVFYKIVRVSLVATSLRESRRPILRRAHENANKKQKQSTYTNGQLYLIVSKGARKKYVSPSDPTCKYTRIVNIVCVQLYRMINIYIYIVFFFFDNIVSFEYYSLGYARDLYD